MNEPVDGLVLMGICVVVGAMMGILWLCWRLIHRVEDLIKQRTSLKRQIKYYEDLIERKGYNVRSVR